MSVAEIEHVLVIPTKVFHQLGHFQGLSTDLEKYLPNLLQSPELSYRPRPEMEEDPSFKQLIPYVLFRHTDTEGTISIFQYTRGKGQGEARLHAKRSVGIGGHISTLDAESANTSENKTVYEEGLRRELSEELRIETPYTEQCVGLLNDDETEVGKVHLGVVHIFDVETTDVFPNEEDISFTGFETVEKILAEMDQFETWSQIAMKALFVK